MIKTMKEDYVSFECAKLLKEKGFNEYVEWAYRYFAENNICVIHINEKPASTLIENCYPYVTLQMAMKWLREVHNKHIQVGYDIQLSWYYDIIDLKETISYDYEEMKCWYNNHNLNNYEESVKDAIKYCLTNLI